MGVTPTKESSEKQKEPGKTSTGSKIKNILIILGIIFMVALVVLMVIRGGQ